MIIKQCVYSTSTIYNVTTIQNMNNRFSHRKQVSPLNIRDFLQVGRFWHFIVLPGGGGHFGGDGGEGWGGAIRHEAGHLGLVNRAGRDWGRTLSHRLPTVSLLKYTIIEHLTVNMLQHTLEYQNSLNFTISSYFWTYYSLLLLPSKQLTINIKNTMLMVISWLCLLHDLLYFMSRECWLYKVYNFDFSKGRHYMYWYNLIAYKINPIVMIKVLRI